MPPITLPGTLRLAVFAALFAALRADNIWSQRTELLKSFNAYEPPPNMHGPAEGHADEGPMKIKVGMAIRKIDFDIISGDLRLTFWLRLKWLDERLAFDATKFSSIDPSKGFLPVPIRNGDERNIWVPDILVINATTDSNEELGEEHAMIYPMQSPKLQEDPPWNVFWARVGTANIHCSPDMKKYPFDRPVCPLYLESWGFPANYIILVKDPDGWQMANAHPSSNEYRFVPDKGIHTEEVMTEWVAIGQNWSSFHATLEFQRFPAYSILHTVVPTGLITLLSTLTFYLPLNEDFSGSGERVGYAATLLLTVIAIILFTAEQRPAVRVATWLDDWCSDCLILTTLPLVQTIFGMYFRALILGHSDGQAQKDKHIEMLLQSEHNESASYVAWAKATHFARGPCLRHFLGPPLPRVLDQWFRHLYPFFVFGLLAHKIPPIYEPDQGSGMIVAQGLVSSGICFNAAQMLLASCWLARRCAKSCCTGLAGNGGNAEAWPADKSSPEYHPMGSPRGARQASARSRGLVGEGVELTDSEESSAEHWPAHCA